MKTFGYQTGLPSGHFTGRPAAKLQRPKSLHHTLKLNVSSTGLFACMFLLFIGLVSTSVAESRPLKDIMGYEEFEDLLQDTVRRIPDLKPFWKDVEEKPDLAPKPLKTCPIFLSGGAFRGVVHWLYEKLQSHSFAEIKKMPVPKIDNFISLPNSDLDLWVLHHDLVRRVKERMPDWDVLGPDFFRSSTKSGGNALEKAGASPWSVTDVLGGLRGYWEGKLGFEWSNSDINEGDLFENSRLAQALRHLRFSLQLPEAHVDPNDLKRFAQLSTTENSSLKDDGANYWILKALRKLFQASGSHGNFRDILSRAGLTPLLTEKKYVFPDEIARYSTHQMKIRLLNSPSADAFVYWLQDYEALAGPGMFKLLLENDFAKTLPWFFGLKPNDWHQRNVQEMLQDYVPRSATIKQFNLLASLSFWNKQNLTDKQNLKENLLRAQSPKMFLDILSYLQMTLDSEEFGKFMKEEFPDTIHAFLFHPTKDKEYKQLLKLLKDTAGNEPTVGLIKTFRQHMALPDNTQILIPESHSRGWTGNDTVMDSLLSASRYDDFLRNLIRILRNSPPNQAKNFLEHHIGKLVFDHFLALGPNQQQLNFMLAIADLVLPKGSSLRQKFGEIKLAKSPRIALGVKNEQAFSLWNKQINNLKPTSRLLEFFETLKQNSQGQFFRWMEKELPAIGTRFFEMNPLVAHVQQFLELFPPEMRQKPVYRRYFSIAKSYLGTRQLLELLPDGMTCEDGWKELAGSP